MAILFECTEDEDDGIYSFQDMRVEVTGGTAGVPADFADFVTFDRAGTAVLLEAEACGVNHTLDEQIRPVEDLAIQITFTLAGTSAGAGDTLDITGTDWRGAAQIESINVAAGNGAYTGAEYWRTITDIDCTGWADGTLKVEQDRWGFIWDYGNGQYLISCHFDVGDGGASTYFADTEKQLTFSSGIVSGNFQVIISVESNATLHLGTLVDATEKATKNGCSFQLKEATHSSTNIIKTNGGKALLYSCNFSADATHSGYTHFGDIAAGSRLWNCNYMGGVGLYNPAANMDINRITVSSSSFGFLEPLAIINDVIVTGSTYAAYLSGATSYTFRNSIFTNNTHDIWHSAYTGTSYLIDCSSDDWALGGGGVGITKRQYTCNIHVADKNGNNLAGVTVDCEDTNGNAVWAAGTITTAADGTIAQQVITYIDYIVAGNVTYSPHIFTLSKAGYETLVKDAITVDGPIDWHLEMLGATGPGVQKQWR